MNRDDLRYPPEAVGPISAAGVVLPVTPVERNGAVHHPAPHLRTIAPRGLKGWLHQPKSSVRHARCPPAAHTKLFSYYYYYFYYYFSYYYYYFSYYYDYYYYYYTLLLLRPTTTPYLTLLQSLIF
eukprot:1192096-Prorocentrum_minimum.AAC.1